MVCRKVKVQLFRSAVHLNEWIAYSDNIGWVMFPAKLNGWSERKPAGGLDPGHLRRIPLDRAFNTGLLEAFQSVSYIEAA